MDKLKLHLLQNTVGAMSSAEQASYYRWLTVRSFVKKVTKKAVAFAKSKTGTAMIAVSLAIIMIVGQAHQRSKVDTYDAKYGVVTHGSSVR